MHLTPAQLDTLKADIVANTATIPAGMPWTGTFAGVQVKDVPRTPDGFAAIAGWYNQPLAPSYFVWKTRLTKEEITAKPSVNADSTARSFIWTGNGFISRTVQEILTFQELFDTPTGAINPSEPTVRQAFTDIFSGTGNAASNVTHCSNHAKRPCTRFERLFAADDGGTGTRGSHGNPDRLGVGAAEGGAAAEYLESPVDEGHVETALNRP